MAELIRLTRQQQEITQQSALAARTGAIQQVTAIEGVTDALRKQQTESDKAGRNAADSNDKVSKSFDALGGQVRSFTSLLATAFAVSEIKSFGLDIIDAKTKIDNLKISLDVMLGSKKESAVLYADIVKLAKETPFTLEEVADNVVKLKAYNIATADLIPTVNALGNIAAAVGKDKLPQLTLAYGQVINMGRLLGTETRQFIEAGVPLYDLLAVSMQKPKSEVIALAAEHRIMAADVKKAVMDASESGGKYYGLMALQAKTVGGEVDKMKDSYQQAKVLIGDYFEDTIQSGTRRLNGLLEATLGTNSAIARTVDVVKSVAAAYIGYTVATRGQNLVDGIAAAYQTAKTIAYGQYLIALRAVTGQQIVFTAAETEAVVAAEAFNVALKANWVGVAIGVITALVSAMYAYKAVTDEVTNALGEEELKLKSEQSELNALTRAAIAAGEGTTDRKKAIELLIQKYPEYFAGIDTEKTTNNQLRSILESVNQSYQDRIALAREAYRADGLKSQQEEVFKREKELFERIKDTNVLNEEVIESFGGSTKKLTEYLKDNGREAMMLNGTWDTFLKGTIGQAARDITKQQAEIESEMAKSARRISDFTEGAAKTASDSLKSQHEVILAQAKGNNAKIEAENERYNTAVAKANGTYREKEIKDLGDHAEKTKQVILLTDKEIAIIKGESNQTGEVDRTKQLQNQLAFLGKQEDAEIESIKKITVNKNTSNAALAALQEQARIKALAIDAKYDLKRSIIIEELEVEEQKNFLLKVQESNDKVAVLTAKRLEAERMLTKLNDAKTNDERLAALREYNQKFTENLQQQGLEQLKIQLDNSKKALDTIATESKEKGDAYRKAYAAWLKDNEQYNAALTQQTITTTKETVKTIQESEKQIQEAHKETAKLEEDTLKRTNQTRKEFLTGLAGLVSQDDGFMGKVGAGLVSLYNGIDGMQSKALAGAKSALKTAEDALSEIKGMFDASTSDGAEAIAEGEENVAKAQAKVAEAEAVTVQGVLGVMGAIYGVLNTIASAINKAMAETYQAIAEGLGQARKAYNDFYDFIEKRSKDAFEEEMKTFTGNLDERIKRINEYYANEKTQIEGRDRIDAMLSYNQDMATLYAKQGQSVGEIMEGIIKAEENQATRKYQLEINKANVAIEQAARVRDETLAILDQQLTDYKKAKNDEIDALKTAETEQINAVTTARDEKIKRQNDELTNFKNNLNDQITALTDNLNQQKALLGIASSDDQIRLTADAVFRKQLMDAGEAREVEALEKSRDRELARTTDAGERTRIMNAYEELIKEKHAEYQTAIGDKSKEVSLAIKEVKAEEATTLQGYELDTATKIKDLKDQILTKEKTTATEIALIQTNAAAETSRIQKETYDLISKIQQDIANQEYQSDYQRKLAQEDYAKAMDASQRAIFANEKALQIASLQAQIAVLNAKKTWYNEGSIIDAVGKIERSIADINGLAYASSLPGATGPAAVLGPLTSYAGQAFVLGFNDLPTQPTRLDDHKTTVNRAYDAKGNFMEITYNNTGKVITAYDKDGKPFQVAFANGYVPATGERLFKGSPYVEGLGYPDGRDTVPAMINKGERVLATADNLAIGGRNLTNEALVGKIKAHDLLMAQYPHLQMPKGFGGMLRLPDGIMNSTGGHSLNVTELVGEMQGFRRELRNFKPVSMTVDRNGLSIHEIGLQSKINRIDALFTR